MIIKLTKDHIIKQTPTCGEIREILLDTEYSPQIAIAINIGQTKGHYHNEFEEIYLVMEGELLLRLYDPATGETLDQRLRENELCVITKGVHHRIIEAAERNRLCAITIPKFDADDEHLSDRI